MAGKGQGRRLYPEDVAAAMSAAAGRPIQVRTVTMALFKANRNRAVGYDTPSDLPVPDGRAWRVTPTDWRGKPKNSPWWWESTIENWLAGRAAALRASRSQASRYRCQRDPTHDSGPGDAGSRFRCRTCRSPLVKERGLWGAYRDGVLVGMSRQSSKALVMAGGGEIRWLPNAVPERVAS